MVLLRLLVLVLVLLKSWSMDDWTALDDVAPRVLQLPLKRKIAAKPKSLTLTGVPFRKRRPLTGKPVAQRSRTSSTLARKFRRQNKLSLLKLPADDLDAFHYKNCHLRNCGHCYYTKNKQKWIGKCPWLEGRSKDGRFGLGCTVCAAAKGVSTVWSRFEVFPKPTGQMYMLSNLLRHCTQKKHRAAAGQADAGMTIVNGITVPARSDFKEVMKALFKRQGFGANGITGVGGYKKVRKLKYCCAEATRILARDQLRSALTMALHQDVRKARLLVRYTACNAKLEVFSGALGQIKLPKQFSLDADGIKAGTLDVIKTFCLERCKPPHCGRERKLIDTGLAHHIRDVVELWDTDAAGTRHRRDY